MSRIPSAFTMGPFRVKVKIVSEKEMAEVAPGYKDAPLGFCDYEALTLYVQAVSKSHSKLQQRHTYWHEYFHMLLHLAGRPRLARDEVLVDTCATLHLQALNTSEK